MNANTLNEALKVLREGGVILYPTDTIWGIGCDATDPEAVARIYAIKRRSDSKSLVLLAGDADMICRYVREIPPMAVQLLEVNDRPMTLIYPGAIAGKAPAAGEKAVADRHFLAYNVVAADGSVGIRLPQAEFCRQLTYRLGRPIVSTSANISGAPAPRAYAEIPKEILAAVDYVVGPEWEKDATGRASQVIRIGMDGQVEILRA